MFSGKRQRMRLSTHRAINRAVLIWIQQVHSKNIPLSGPTIKEKADQFTREMGVEFTATNGWFYRFKI